MRTNKIRLTESQLHKVIKESVKRVLGESNFVAYNGDNGAKQHSFNEYLHSENNGGYPYVIITYENGEEVDIDYVYLPKQGLHSYDNEVPYTLGSNQVLIELDD